MNLGAQGNAAQRHMDLVRDIRQSMASAENGWDSEELPAYRVGIIVEAGLLNG